MARWKIPKQGIIFIPSSEHDTHHELMLKVGRNAVWRVRFTHVELDDDSIQLKDENLAVAWLRLIPDMDRVSGQTVYRRCLLIKDGEFWWAPEDVSSNLWGAVTALIPRSCGRQWRTRAIR
jgi:hypothetical protein